MINFVERLQLLEEERAKALAHFQVVSGRIEELRAIAELINKQAEEEELPLEIEEDEA